MPDDVVLCLHGDLDLKIIQARKLPNMDIVSERFRRFFSGGDGCMLPCSPKNNKRTSHLRNKIITSDPYVTVCLAGATVARTRVISNSQDPEWNENFKIPLAHPVSQVEFQVKDNDMFGARLIGVATVLATKIKSGEIIHDWFPIIAHHGRPLKPDCAVLIQMKFTPCEENKLYRTNLGLKESYFPVRHGGDVTLYQDAHATDGSLPEIKLDNNKIFKNENCWEDICHAILEAHHLIYIVGWSIYSKVKLVREASRPLPSGGNLNLGELLKYKSQEGVRVLLLVWDDKTSHNKFFFPSGGVMQTHDQETRKFFKHSSVHCVLSPRYASNKLSFIKQQVVGTLYTHHQKCVIVDTQASGNNRKITSFLGGLDLCDGRYDTPQHRLFKDLNTVFQEDFHNPTLAPGTMGPREPWHDLHCKLEGPAAYDVLTNFEQRWRKASKWSELQRHIKQISHWHDDALLKVERISWIISPSSSVPSDDNSLWVKKEEDPENWHVQVFRSIDSGSVNGFPKDMHLVEAQNLIRAKNIVVDRSIQTAYIHAIRSAQNFIYIENQYFIGSSYAWPSHKNAGADNLIPMEIALKVASKIRANERFSVYIVIPMWPEGTPASGPVQEILYWQRQTMQMMYTIIAKELKAMKLDHMHPTDYLNFYCLGNKEEWQDDVFFPPPGCNGESVSNSLKYGRFMIYVHAKGMIVDDEYVILGSANINQRSMAGSRDTEIAMGAYQPHHTRSEKGKPPRGQVYGYRMSLWAEHMEKIEHCFDEPESMECVTHVNKISEDNWKKYVGKESTPLQGHLLKYPVAIDGKGKVRPLPGHESFPDVGGKVLGSQNSLPDALTT